jgi:hypothetical protein
MFARNFAALKVSHEVALRKAEANIHHAVAEELILPSAIDMVKVALEVHVVSEMQSIALLNNTISHRIYAMIGDVNEHLISMFRPTRYV